MQRNIKGFLIGVLVLIVSYATYQLSSSLKQNRVLKNRISQIQKENEYFQEELNEAGQMIESLKASLAVKTKQALEEQDKAKNLEGRLLKSKEEINKLTEELNLVKNKKKFTEDRLQAAVKKIQDLKNSKRLSRLKKRLTQLSKSLGQKSKELAKLEKKLNTLEKTNLALSETNKSLVEKIKELEQVKVEQITQFSAILTERELGLQAKQKEAETLRGEVSNLQARLLDLESQLSEARAEQEKTIRLLTEAAQLNAALEEKLGSFLQPQDAKEKAEELKRKVEVFMYPGRKP